MKKYFVLFLAIGLVLVNCKKNDDDGVTPVVATEDPVEDPVVEDPVVETLADYPVQLFMWQAMNAYYFWQSDVPDLADSKLDLAEADFDLLFGDIDTYIMNFATIENNTISPNGRELSLTKQEGLSENPILISKVIERDGIKIGYLLYNSFIATYDEQLNDAFGEFKTAGVTELILDFRYNGGGRVSSAIQIASSVYGTKTDELFLKARYNDKIQSSFNPGDGEDNFFSTTLNDTPINALDLSRVYVIATGSSASASELVMNGLEPYVDVVHVGTTTVGKNEFSITFVDDRDNGFIYNADREANINPDNQWAIQPLLGRNENADGFSDYTGGLIPDHVLQEDITNLNNLGDPIEPLLALTLSVISGSTGKTNFEPIFPVDLISTSCSKNDDSIKAPGTVNPDPSAGVAVQDFMWKAMNFWYFWQADMPNLADDNFLSDNYVELTNQLSGISKSNGLEFGLVRFSGSDDIFGYVQYIITGSDASGKDIQRGEIFTGVNGQALNLTNYRGLLFGDSDTYTLNMASFVDGEITPNDKEVILTKQEGLAENPVFLDKIFEINGKKIGYIVYNSFTNEYDEQLNEAFGRFKSGGVTDLVVDFRYNPGGSVRTSTFISSMIYGTNTNDVFLKARYNDKYQKLLDDNNSETRRFFADKTGAGTAINTLNLSKVYIITTNGSASASELVINGLAPYLDVVQIGETTRGKNEFSVTMVDDRESDFGPYVYNAERKNQIKQGNNWAIQPLIGRNENADGFSDYTAGLVPDIVLEEDLENLGVLGDQNEPLLAKAIEQITGATGKRDFTVKTPARMMTNSKMFTPIKDNMYVTELPLIQ
ncbi:Carboxyl-terminal-processing protease [Nymphon striatum]|nr:Carboxyl-terminal-processing protease [Nymphon striatum]